MDHPSITCKCAGREDDWRACKLSETHFLFSSLSCLEIACTYFLNCKKKKKKKRKEKKRKGGLSSILFRSPLMVLVREYQCCTSHQPHTGETSEKEEEGEEEEEAEE